MGCFTKRSFPIFAALLLIGVALLMPRCGAVPLNSQVTIRMGNQ